MTGIEFRNHQSEARALLTKKMHEKYPKLFQPCECRFYGRNNVADISIWKGWFPLLDRTLDSMQQHVDQHNKYCESRGEATIPQPVIFDIKEKFALMRIYIRPSNEFINGLVDAAETESGCICEYCGSNQEVGRQVTGWMKTICKSCNHLLVGPEMNEEFVAFSAGEFYLPHTVPIV